MRTARAASAVSPPNLGRSLEFLAQPAVLDLRGFRRLHLVLGSRRCEPHTGCLVKWKEGQREYVCACHQARFDENGEVVAGQPPRPLPTLPVRISGGDVWIGS